MKYQVYYINDNGKKIVEFAATLEKDCLNWIAKMNHAYGGILKCEQKTKTK